MKRKNIINLTMLALIVMTTSLVFVKSYGRPPWRRGPRIGRPLDNLGLGSWDVFNATQRPILFEPWGGPGRVIWPNQTKQVIRGGSFRFAIRDIRSRIAFRRGRTRRHFVIIRRGGYMITSTDYKEKWLRWIRFRRSRGMV